MDTEKEQEESKSRNKVLTVRSELKYEYEPKEAKSYQIHSVILKVYTEYCLESTQEVCAALELFGYMVHVSLMKPSIELILVCLVLTSKFYSDRSLWISDILKYCCHNKFVYELERKVALIYFHTYIPESTIVSNIYKSLNMTDRSKLLEGIIIKNLSLEIVRCLIDYGGSLYMKFIRKRCKKLLREWAIKIKEEYVRTVMQNPYVSSCDIYLKELIDWYHELTGEKITFSDLDDVC